MRSGFGWRDRFSIYPSCAGFSLGVGTHAQRQLGRAVWRGIGMDEDLDDGEKLELNG